jgi:hypothetical protein
MTIDRVKIINNTKITMVVIGRMLITIAEEDIVKPKVEEDLLK